jgi:hypothetical protein
MQVFTTSDTGERNETRHSRSTDRAACRAEPETAPQKADTNAQSVI